MTQQVNLYQPIFRREPKILSAATLSQITLIFVAALGTIYAYGYWQLEAQRQELEQLSQRKAAASERLERFKGRYGEQRTSPRLERRVAELRDERDTKAQLLTLLDERGFGNTQGFSSYLDGLARRHVEGLWLTRFTVAEGGNDLSLSGRALRPEAVPQFLQRLSEETAFSGKRFRSLVMQRPEQARAAVDFQLQSEPAEADKR